MSPCERDSNLLDLITEHLDVLAGVRGSPIVVGVHDAVVRLVDLKLWWCCCRVVAEGTYSKMMLSSLEGGVLRQSLLRL